MRILAAIAVGGALGALFRYGISGLMGRLFPGAFPLGTLTVNVGGSFLIGWVWIWLERMSGAPNLRAFAVVGLLGAFTTFSTYSLEILLLGRMNDMRIAALSFLASNLLCLAAVAAGYFLARFVYGAL